MNGASYTVKQLSDLANVSVRTLHYYDEIGLLKPSAVGANSYRYYDDDALLRLQQILFYREIGMELGQIKGILDSPDFDLVAALYSHRTVIEEKIDRLRHLMGTIDQTIGHLTGDTAMSRKQLFEGFSEEKQKQYEREARLQWGPATVNESIKRWNGYTPLQREAIQEEGGQVYLDLAAAIDAGKSAGDAEVQAILSRWHKHIHYFYEPTYDILRGLAEGYNTHPDFIAFFEKIHPHLAPFLREAIPIYVDALETEEIRRMLAEDEAARTQG